VNGYHPSYNTSTNRIVGLTYDAVGNLTQDGTKTMGYDANNKLVSATATGGGTVSYLYDASGSRVSKTVGSTTTWYIYGLDGELVAEYGAQGAVGSPQKEYGYRGGQMLVVYDSTEVGDKQLQWLVQDQLGSTRMVVDLSGSLTGMKRHDYLPFGEEISANVGIRSTANGYAADRIRQKFTGYERDAETGLDYAQARMYANWQGRFTSVDPYNPIVDTENNDEFNKYLEQPQNWNQYAYVWNNPLKHTDPNGEKVYVVTYTTGNSEGDESFKRAAETRAAEIRKQKGFDSKKDTVLLKGVYSKDDFKNVLKEANSLDKKFGKVEQVTLFSHAGEGQGPVFHDSRLGGSSTQFTNQELAGLKVNWSGSASASFIGCNTGINFAQNFANAQGVTTYGYDKYAYFSSRRDKMVPDPGPRDPVYLIAADYGTANGIGAAARYTLGMGKVYSLVRRDPPKKK
jgi:RHS repeat-associated protein